MMSVNAGQVPIVRQEDPASSLLPKRLSSFAMAKYVSASTQDMAVSAARIG
jgi:hypothetical protein